MNLNDEFITVRREKLEEAADCVHWAAWEEGWRSALMSIEQIIESWEKSKMDIVHAQCAKRILRILRESREMAKQMDN